MDKFVYSCDICGFSSEYASKNSMYVGKCRHMKTKKHLKRVEANRKECLTKETGILLTEPTEEKIAQLLQGYSATNRATTKVAERTESKTDNLINLVRHYREDFKELRESVRQKERMMGTIRNQLESQMNHLSEQNKSQQKQIEELIFLCKSNNEKPIQSYPILSLSNQTRESYPKAETNNELIATTPITPESEPEVEMWEGEPLYTQSVCFDNSDKLETSKEDKKKLFNKAIEAVKIIRQRTEKIEKTEQAYPDLQEIENTEKEIDDLKEQLLNPELSQDEIATIQEELDENRAYLTLKQEEYKIYIANETYWDSQVIKGKMEEVAQYKKNYGVNLLSLQDYELVAECQS